MNEIEKTNLNLTFVMNNKNRINASTDPHLNNSRSAANAVPPKITYLNFRLCLPKLILKLNSKFFNTKHFKDKK